MSIKDRLPSLNFISLHYLYIIACGFLGFVVIYPYGNVAAVDSYFFGASASTESGLNTFDVKDLKTYQQLYLYFIPIITNLGFINIMVVVVRLRWFDKRLKLKGPALLSSHEGRDIAAASVDPEKDAQPTPRTELKAESNIHSGDEKWRGSQPLTVHIGPATDPTFDSRAPPTEGEDGRTAAPTNDPLHKELSNTRITFEEREHPSHTQRVLVVPPPQERDKGSPLVELDKEVLDDDEPKPIKHVNSAPADERRLTRKRTFDGPAFARATSMEIANAASSMFVLGGSRSRGHSQTRHPKTAPSPAPELPYLSSQVTVGRNSQFRNLSAQDRELLGGIEYRSLKLLLKIVVGYFFGLHLLGVIGLVPWIQYAEQKYLDWLAECGQNRIWWAFYSAQTMVDNLGFTLTPDSMSTFRDATWPMILMSFLAYAGNTLYPVFLRLLIWTISKLTPKNSSLQEPLHFLLNHPRRCYTLLFPSGTTWVLFIIIFVMNSIDVLLIIVLDLHNDAVADLPVGSRILASIFQAASARHTGTSTFNLAEVNPAVQFSLLVMMYISIFPIALSIRASNVYEEKTIGIYETHLDMDENSGSAYLMKHFQNQLSFDLWYIFLGVFCICIAEADKITDLGNPAFSVFPIFFEVTSAYGNVGLSLGHPSTMTSLSGKFTTFSKVVICAMMIRGRHRGLPYALDHAIKLPTEHPLADEDPDPNSSGSTKDNTVPRPLGASLNKSHTQ